MHVMYAFCVWPELQSDALRLLDKPQIMTMARCRLSVGGKFTMGNPESVSFNPVQADVLDYGIIS